MPASASPALFISYRREDSGLYARLLKTRLAGRFPRAQVFMDLDSIEAGLDFAEAIGCAVRSCTILLALIGRGWLTAAGEDGGRRLDDPGDFVRFEIRTALERRVRVIPVLLDGAAAPREHQLPDDLRKLARLNPLEISCARYDYDETRLMTAIRKALEPGNGTPGG
jgi:hypothetical protein